MEQQSQLHIAEMEQQAKYMEQQIERQSQQHREEMQNLLKLFDVQKYGTGEDDSSTHHPQLLFHHLLHLIRNHNCGQTTGQDSVHLWWPMLYLSNARHKFSLPINLLLYTNNWLTWLLNKLCLRASTR